MGRIRLKIKAGDQKWGTRYNSRRCSGATASVRAFGGTARWGGSTAVINGRRYRLGSDARQVPALHDAGDRVGTRTVTLYGAPIQTLEEQAEAARKARTTRREARTTRREKAAAKRAEAAEQAKAKAAERPGARAQARAAALQQPSVRDQASTRQPDTREQARAGERTRSDEDVRAERDRAQAQEAEAARLLRASGREETTVPRARQAEPSRQARAPQPQPRAGERVRDGDDKAGRERAQAQETEASRLLAEARTPRAPRTEARERVTVPQSQPGTAEPATTAVRQTTRAPQSRAPRAIEAPESVLMRRLRNPFAAREEAERQPEPALKPAAARRNPR